MQSQDRLRRDLRWCLESTPLLIADTWSKLVAESMPTADLPAPPHPHQFRLGQHFEHLLLAWLRHASGYELVDHNVQVQDGKRTVGEFDFLLRAGGRSEHWEAAIKFYLGVGDCGIADWYGPNTVDRLDIKYARLINHQLKLATDPNAARYLRERNLAAVLPRCFMKGRLFHPWAHFQNGRFVTPAMVSPAHEKGWWISYSDFLQEFQGAGYRYLYLPKMMWLSPLLPIDCDDPLSFWELTEFLASRSIEPATHIAVVDTGGREIHRGFVVTDQWVTAASTPVIRPS